MTTHLFCYGFTYGESYSGASYKKKKENLLNGESEKCLLWKWQSEAYISFCTHALTTLNHNDNGSQVNYIRDAIKCLTDYVVCWIMLLIRTLRVGLLSSKGLAMGFKIPDMVNKQILYTSIRYGTLGGLG